MMNIRIDKYFSEYPPCSFPTCSVGRKGDRDFLMRLVRVVRGSSNSHTKFGDIWFLLGQTALQASFTETSKLKD
jgi:hypothetical protein